MIEYGQYSSYGVDPSIIGPISLDTRATNEVFLLQDGMKVFQGGEQPGKWGDLLYQVYRKQGELINYRIEFSKQSNGPLLPKITFAPSFIKGGSMPVAVAYFDTVDDDQAPRTHFHVPLMDSVALPGPSIVEGGTMIIGRHIEGEDVCGQRRVLTENRWQKFGETIFKLGRRQLTVEIDLAVAKENYYSHLEIIDGDLLRSVIANSDEIQLPTSEEEFVHWCLRNWARDDKLGESLRRSIIVETSKSNVLIYEGAFPPSAKDFPKNQIEQLIVESPQAVSRLGRLLHDLGFSAEVRRATREEEAQIKRANKDNY